MTPADIQAIRDALAAGPTSGEWVACGPSFGDPLPRFLNEVISPDEADGGETVACALQGAEGLADADMAYIAAVHPERIARLLAALEDAQRSAALVRAQALEDAARVCDQRAKEMWGFTEEEHASEACAAAIRALATQAQRETP